jgi:hypothetical protein
MFHNGQTLGGRALGARLCFEGSGIGLQRRERVSHVAECL